MDKKLKSRVINLVRRDLKKTPQYKNAKQKNFKGMTVYQCPECNTHYYTGSSSKNFDELKESKYPDLVRIKPKDMHMDHVEPLVPYDTSQDECDLETLVLRAYFVTI